MLGANTHSSTRGFEGLVISNSPASMALWVSEAKICADTRSESRRHSSTRGTVNDDAEYSRSRLYDLHVCRVVPNPPEVLRTTSCWMRTDGLQRHERPTSSFASEHCATGASSTMSTKSQRRRCSPRPIRRGDAATVSRSSTTFRTCAGRSSKLEPHAFVEEPERYLDVVEGFLANYDQ